MELSSASLSFSEQSKPNVEEDGESQQSHESQDSESEEKVTYARSKKVMEMDAL